MALVRDHSAFGFAAALASSDLHAVLRLSRLQRHHPFVPIVAKGRELLRLAGQLRIADGEVLVNGEVCTQRGKKLYPGDSFRYDNTDYVITAAT